MSFKGGGGMGEVKEYTFHTRMEKTIKFDYTSCDFMLHQQFIIKEQNLGFTHTEFALHK